MHEFNVQREGPGLQYMPGKGDKTPIHSHPSTLLYTTGTVSGEGFDLSPVALQRRTTFCEPAYVQVVSQMRIPQRNTLPLCHFADLRGLTC